MKNRKMLFVGTVIGEIPSRVHGKLLRVRWGPKTIASWVPESAVSKQSKARRNP